MCHAMQCILYKIYFWKVFHMNYNLICTPICTKKKFYSCKKWVLQSCALTSSSKHSIYFNRMLEECQILLSLQRKDLKIQEAKLAEE
jgi:hypothetical protein